MTATRFYVTWLRFTHGAGERSGNVDLERAVTVTGLRGDEVDMGRRVYVT